MERVRKEVRGKEKREEVKRGENNMWGGKKRWDVEGETTEGKGGKEGKQVKKKRESEIEFKAASQQTF